ncbi:hypothetical protein SERLA73DRAFT_188867 [Serpula lacrymans var. lacrymans S7.3]|uniref:CBF1-interacting co-repressor CIR N-terminal domain-containing protein n=2 Tax=Serpula lacrymans var. lacrymans TaxID=341189 RepID=F8QCB3_SERL3|nr:uncharacterized protein SERLADRAFT_479468 [Serpula lacrymans var. lacrymans S7.9]EGN94232.1 hypothetical protein SERLA73DRAFT_188867 [Serpula lacrymans var. lacrymans S7.3]EGO19724.1 hypothetical protein SERLADRAFT_479468 [Serpula lacrymans var. lacrymans S7.9]
MGKLNIAHHKSYHPYRLDNIDRVRKDEEEARDKEAREEDRLMLADSEARIEKLRDRAGLKDGKRKEKEDDMAIISGGSSSAQSSSLPTSKGHINLFEDIELHAQVTMTRASKKTEAQLEAEKGVPLAPSAKDLKPWYSERSHERNKEPEEEKQARDLAFKSRNDPLTSITHQLASRSSTNKFTTRSRPQPRPILSSSSFPDDVSARLSRESSERQRALDLIRRKKKELAGSETPSTVHGGNDDRNSGYGDVFNKRAVEEAHRGRDRRWGEDDRRRYRPNEWQ